MAVADALISKVVDMLVSNIEEEFRLIAGVEEEVQKLTSSLQSIQAVLVDAERRQWKEVTTVQLWLDRLKHVTYDIDDVVDEWSYEILRSKTDQREEKARKPTSKVWSSKLVSACYIFPKVVSRHHMAVKISDLNARLNVIAIEKDRYSFQLLRSNIEQVERSITTSGISIAEVKGRDVDKEKLVSMFLASSSEMSKLRLIPVVGMGGIGKTTLAKLVFNDERVKSHFHERIWVCVSDPFDESRIAKEILESLQGSNSNLASLPNIIKNIQETFVEGKEYLFVFDDVWNEDPNKWKQLEDCLKGSLSKSKILVTTRNENVGRIMGCLESDIIKVGLLSEEECWELFCMIAFSSRSSEERESLEKLGKEIVARCKGLPLAVKAIAGLLRFKERRIEWQSVLDSHLWGLEDVNRDIVGPLWLSYYDLPSPLKRCFSYCAIFPKDYLMEKYELINLWIAQGYLKETQSKDMETIGEEYFQNLVMRSFFQDIEVHNDVHSIARTYSKMHDIVHDFAQLLVKRECLSIEVNNDNDAINLDDSNCNLLRHLSISFKDGVGFRDSFYNLKKLHSLIISSSTTLDLKKIFSDFVFLRSLTLSKCGIVEVPSNINRLIHLRELNLSHNIFLIELPDTVWELYNLQILNLTENNKMQYVKGLGRLTNLRHLVNNGTKFLLPKDIVKLGGLRRLNEVKIDTDNEEAFSLKHLKNFNQLSGVLHISWVNRGDGDVEDAKQAHLKDKKYITHLKLNFGDHDTHWTEKQDDELIEALNVPPNLEFLGINFYMGLGTLNWLDSLTALKMVQLHFWPKCQNLPTLGKLPCLEYLTLSNFHSVRKVGAEFLGMESSSRIIPFFPKLKTLRFYHFDNWEEWSDVDEEVLIMPSLTYLVIWKCSKMNASPNFITKKTSLKVHRRY